MERIIAVVQKAQSEFYQLMQKLEANGGLTEERYTRYLSMQYHLTKGVQSHFFAIASHSCMAHKKSLRKFLINFGIEEEPHYNVAEKDLDHMGAKLQPIPLDVELWWAYFNNIVPNRPFVRLGATCVLENISGQSRNIINKLVNQQKYLNQKNTHFLVIHQHEILPHGDQIIAALADGNLDQEQIKDLYEGSCKGFLMYMRCIQWVINGKEIY